VTSVRFTIRGAGIDDIVQTVPAVPGVTMTVTLQVPSGPARTILVEALDSDGISRFRGATLIDASGLPLSITIGMAAVPSNPALQTWTLVDNNASSTLYRIVEGDAVLLTGGAGREVLSSLDGISWTSHTSEFFPGNIDGLAFGDNTFLAMTSTGNFTALPVTWTNRFFGAASDNVDDWTARGIIGTVDLPLADLAFGGGVFVAVGDNAAFHSLDNGATWSPGTISGMQGLSRVAYGNGRFVTFGGAGDNVAVSTDGIQWETGGMGLSPTESPDLLGFGNGIFLATTSAGNVYTSSDGIAWQPRTRFADLPGLDISTYSVAPGGGGFMVVTSSGLFFTFDSGGTWTAVDPGASVYDGIYFNGRFLLVGDEGVSGSGGVFRSGDL
jgi:hypothetical protein